MKAERGGCDRSAGSAGRPSRLSRWDRYRPVEYKSLDGHRQQQSTAPDRCSYGSGSEARGARSVRRSVCAMCSDGSAGHLGDAAVWALDTPKRDGVGRDPKALAAVVSFGWKNGEPQSARIWLGESTATRKLESPVNGRMFQVESNRSGVRPTCWTSSKNSSKE